MTETLRYSLLGKQDIRTEPRSGTFEVTLADGRVVTLNSLDVAHYVSDAYTAATVPDQDTGQIYRLTDSYRGLWAINQAGRAFALNGRVIDVREFGATGDGTTDDQDAIAACFAVSGAKTVRFPAGTYLMEGVIINDDDTTIIVDAGATIKRRAVNTSVPYLFAVMKNRFRMYGPGTLDGNRTALQGSQPMAMVSINLTGSQTADVEDVLITGLTFKNIPNVAAGQNGDAIRTPLHTETYTVRDLRIIGNCFGPNIARNGVTFTHGKNIVVAGNTFISCEQTAIDCEGTGVFAVEYVSVVGNVIRNVGGVGGKGIDGGARYGVFAHNVIDCGNVTATNGIVMGGAGAYCLVEGNIIQNCGSVGLAIEGSTGTRVRGNLFHTINSRGITTDSGDCEITGNYFYNWNQAGGGTDRAAIQITSGGAGYNYIANNMFEKVSGGTASTAIALQSTGNNRVGVNRYKGDILSRVKDRVASDTVDHNDETVAKTTDYTIDHTNDFGKTFTNSGAGGTVTISLPAGVVGQEYGFIRTDAQSFRIDPSNTWSIRGGGAGKYLELDTNGDSVRLRCVVALTWEIIAINGVVAYEP